MRIAILTEYYPGPENLGSGVYVHARAVGYRAAGHDVRVYRVRSWGEDRYEHEEIRVFSGGPTAGRSELARFGPSVVALHTPYPGTPHVRLAESVAVPRVVWVHGYEAMVTAFHGYHQGMRRVLSLAGDLVKLWRLRSALPGAAAVVFVSDWLRETVEKTLRYRHPNAHVIPNPVDVTRFTPADGPDDRASVDAGVARGLVLRPLDRRHGVDVAVEAFAGLNGTLLTIVGQGGAADRIRGRIERNGLPVRLECRTVPHAEMPGLLRRFDYLVSPERKTPTQGVAMCEAMACGLPVIGPRAGGVPEYVRDGVDGYLVRRGDPAALRAAVQRLLADPDGRRRMGRNARERVVATCAAAAVRAAELEVLEEAAS